MAPTDVENSSETNRLLGQAALGDGESLGALLTRHEGRLRRMVAFRLDPRLQGRIAHEDVLQEVYLAAAEHLSDYFAQTAMTFFFWLRGIAGHKLLELHRSHLGTRMRDVRREVSLHHGALPDATSAALAAQLLGHHTRPSEAAVRAEAKIRLQEALNGMDPIDREVLALRHFEQLTNAEVARVLNIKEAAAGKRYLRALGRLREILATMPGACGGEVEGPTARPRPERDGEGRSYLHE
jgi:RNA polymerase sigma-70 factor, ECF subfamily